MSQVYLHVYDLAHIKYQCILLTEISRLKPDLDVFIRNSRTNFSNKGPMQFHHGHWSTKDFHQFVLQICRNIKFAMILLYQWARVSFQSTLTLFYKAKHQIWWWCRDMTVNNIISNWPICFAYHYCSYLEAGIECCTFPWFLETLGNSGVQKPINNKG